MEYIDLRSKKGIMRYSVSHSFMLNMIEQIKGKWKNIPFRGEDIVVYEFTETTGVTISGEIYLPVFKGDYLDVNGDN